MQYQLLNVTTKKVGFGKWSYIAIPTGYECQPNVRCIANEKCKFDLSRHIYRVFTCICYMREVCSKYFKKTFLFKIQLLIILYMIYVCWCILTVWVNHKTNLFLELGRFWWMRQFYSLFITLKLVFTIPVFIFWW